MNDERKHWEVVWNVRLGFAADYVKYLSLAGRERTFAADAYTDNGELETWARGMIRECVEKANAMVDEHGAPSIAALAVAKPYVEKLAAVAWPNGTVPLKVAGTMRIDQE